MKIIKVFLAKSFLARGLDVELIKSSLMKVANLAIIESGSRIKPSECEIFIYVPGKDDSLDTEKLPINKVVSLKLEDFIKNETNMHKKHLFVLKGIDINREIALCDRVELSKVSEHLSENCIPLQQYYDNDGGVDIIGEICGIFPHLNFNAIKSAPLRHQPSGVYGLPPIPSHTKRMLGKFNMRNLQTHEKPSKYKKK